MDDVLTTGKPIREVLEVLDREGAEMVGVAILVDRSSGKVDFGVPTKAMLNVDVVAYDPKECPMCKKGLEITKPSSRDI
ncbi:phosphoribosyltransferase family protein [Halonatronum saccharophilum]|uniref:phosphoribosyltransferase family protein n=1 Tax=Halonatronum saccharophilum TaxID=150060 RepID=UPI0024807555|nr:phosphoribosyltransferase family protein [Halonatronum saccharophilum]